MICHFDKSGALGFNQYVLLRCHGVCSLIALHKVNILVAGLKTSYSNQ